MNFFSTLPDLEEVDKADADVAWLVYGLKLDTDQNRYALELRRTVYTKFEQALLKITRSEAGEEQPFKERLRTRLNTRLNGGNDSDHAEPHTPF